MKVLQIIPHYLPAYQYGGPIYSVHNLAKAMVEKGVDVSVWTTNLGLKDRYDIPLCEEVLIDGVKVYYFPIIGTFHYSLSPALMKYMKDRIRDFDIVHIQGVYQFHSLIGGYYARKYGIPYVLSPKGMLIPEMIKKKGKLKKYIYISLVEKNNVEKANLIQCASEVERQKLLKIGFELRDTVVIPNIVKLEKGDRTNKKEKFRDKYGLKQKQLVLFLGRLNWTKGIDILIPAFAIVLTKFPDTHLVLAGPDTERYIRKVKKWIRNEGIENKVTFTGLLTGNEKLAALAESDIFVLPSYSENFGMAAVEAMYMGLPVIISKEVGIKDEIKQNECGIIVDINPISIAEGICYLLHNPEEKKKLGAKGKKIARNEFSAEGVAKKMIQSYKDIIG